MDKSMRREEHRRSQQNKKHHSQRLRKGVGPSEVTKVGSTTKSQIPETKQPEENTQITHEDDSSRLFARRRVLSNWSRYDDQTEPGETDTDGLPRGGRDFGELANQQPEEASSQFRFRDELDWDKIVSDEGNNNVFRVDLVEISRALKCIPLPKRLGISEEFFTSEQIKQFTEEANNYQKIYDGEDSCCTDSDGSQEVNDRNKSQADNHRHKLNLSFFPQTTRDAPPPSANLDGGGVTPLDFRISSSNSKLEPDKAQTVTAVLIGKKLKSAKEPTGNQFIDDIGVQELLDNQNKDSKVLTTEPQSDDIAAKDLEDWLDSVL